MKHSDILTEQGKLLYIEINKIERDLMYNENTLFSIFDLQSATNRFLDLTKPIQMKPNFNSNQKLY